MSGINDLRQTTAMYKEKYRSFSSEFLRFREGDVLLFYFCGDGEPGDPFFEVYMAHEIPAPEGQQGKRYWYCPVLSNHQVPQNYQCQWCNSKVKSKRRMGMWMYVQAILHTSQMQGENFPQVNWKGINYFQEDINDFKRWDTSAWDESPLEDIFMVHMQFGSLRTQRSIMTVTGKDLKRRYKIAGEPNTAPLPPTHIQAAQEQCEPIMQILMKKLAQANDTEPVIRSLDNSPTMGLPVQNANGFTNPPQPQGGFAPPQPQGFPQPQVPQEFPAPPQPQEGGGFNSGFGNGAPPQGLPPRGQPLF